MMSQKDKMPFRILCVDDEEHQINIYKKVLGDDYYLETARSAEQARAILREKDKQIAVLFSDVRMPGETGVDLSIYARKTHPHIVTILSSAYASYDAKAALQAINEGGIFKYLQKPVNIEVMKTEVRNAVDHFMEMTVAIRFPEDIDVVLDEFRNSCDLWELYINDFKESVHSLEYGLQAILNLYESYIQRMKNVDNDQKIVIKTIMREYVDNVVENSLVHHDMLTSPDKKIH